MTSKTEKQEALVGGIFLVVAMLVLANFIFASDSELPICHEQPEIRKLDSEIRQIEIEILSIANGINRGKRYYNCRSFLLLFEQCDDRKILEEDVVFEKREMQGKYGSLPEKRKERAEEYKKCYTEHYTSATLPKGFWD